MAKPLNYNSLNTTIYRLFSVEKRSRLRQILAKFKKDSSVPSLVQSLKQIVTTTEQYYAFLVKLSYLVPADLQQDFNDICRLQFEGYSPVLARLRPEHLHNGGGTNEEGVFQVVDDLAGRCYYLERHGNETRLVTSHSGSCAHVKISPPSKDRSPTAGPSRQELNRRSRPKGRAGPNGVVKSDTLRLVTLKRSADTPYGFTIRGGREYGVGAFVSSVEPDSLAARKGLRSGEKIVKVNATALSHLTHAESVGAIRKCRVVRLMLGGMTKEEIKAGQTSIETSVNENTINRLTANRTGQRPPAVAMGSNSTRLTRNSSQGNKTGVHPSPSFRCKYEKTLSSISIVAGLHGYLGCSLRGGVDMNLPLVISGVEESSPSFKAGLRVWDKIISINEVPVLDLSHGEAVQLMVSGRKVQLKVHHRLPAGGVHDVSNVRSTTATSHRQSEHCQVSRPKQNQNHQLGTNNLGTNGKKLVSATIRMNLDGVDEKEVTLSKRIEGSSARKSKRPASMNMFSEDPPEEVDSCVDNTAR